MYRALVSFSGRISMAEGEVRAISDKEVVKDLLNAKYIEEVKTEKPEAKPKGEKPEEKPEEKSTKKKTSTKKKATKK